jgi:dTDP-glucose 4,6-dehydratase
MSFSETILITGGAGFIGSNFIHYFLNKYDKYRIVNLDKLTYAGDLDNLKECEGNSNHVFIQGDICDRDLVKKLFSDYQITGVIHFAAESHVDNSISDPSAFIKTNIEGTFTLLEEARRAWNGADHRFHHVSTDEVYGTLGDTGYFTETTPYAPNSPYSASKASSDMIARSYVHTYGMNITISSCSNNFGPRQHQEKLIPTIIRTALAGKPIPIYGSGKNVRDWLFVDDHCIAIDLIYHQGAKGEVYNVGGDKELDNLSLAGMVCDILDKVRPLGNSYKQQISFVEDRAGHDYRYAIDFSKIKRELGWVPSADFMGNLLKTLRYYLDK